MALHPKSLREKGRHKASQVLQDWQGPFYGSKFVEALGTEFVGALGELAAARIVKARIVSHLFRKRGPFDLCRGHHTRFEVKSTFTKQISPDLSGRRFDRYCEVKLEVRSAKNDIEIWAVECFTRNKGRTGLSMHRKTRSFRPFRVFVAPRVSGGASSIEVMQKPR